MKTVKAKETKPELNGYVVNKFPFAGIENICRAYEVAKVGGFKVKFYTTATPECESEYMTENEVSQLPFVFAENESDAQIILHYPEKPSFEKILTKRIGETMEDVHQRIEQFKKNPEVESGRLDESSYQLLKCAYLRLNMTKTSIENSIRIAAVIAQMGNCTTVEAQHIAEAIQYSRAYII